MELRQLGRSGVRVSRLGLGTMTWGRDTDEHEAAEQLRFYLDAGGNFIDTAAVYGNGDAERVLGGFLGVMVPRDQIIIATKAGISFKSGERVVDNSRTSLIADLDRSLSHLRTDYVDLWQIHTWDENTPLEETLGAFDDLIRSGKVLYIGFSEWNAQQIAAALKIQDEKGYYRYISSQPQYSMLWRVIESEVIPLCEKEGIGQIVWSPIAQGVLTGKYLPGQKAPAGSRATDKKVAQI